MQLVLKKCTIRPWRLDDAESVAAMSDWWMRHREGI